MESSKTYEQLCRDNQELQWQLEEANETINAIRNGKIDAIVVNGETGHRIYTLKTADQTFRLFIEKMNEGAITINRERVIIYSNTRFASMVGMPLQKVIGLSLDVFIPEESIEQYSAMIASAWINDCKDELYLQNKKGKEICCLVSCNMLEMEEGISLSLIITDLTAQKEIQERLASQNVLLEQAREQATQLNNQLEMTVKERTKDLSISREHFKMLSDHITQMTWTNLPNGEVNYYNQRWFQYTGLSIDDARDWGWQSVVHPDDLEETIAKYRKALHSSEVFEMENRYRRKDGIYRWHLNRAMPLRNDSGEIIFWVGTATDIDDQKRELERKDEFIGVASHELKTPLTSMKGYLQLITANAKDTLSPTVKNYLERANNSIHKLQHLVDDLLDVSKINAGRLNYALDPVDLSVIVNASVENAAHMYKSFEFKTDNNLKLMVNGNSERLEQVIMNLLSNAVKYSTDDKRVLIETSRFENYARVSVTDFGIGLRKEQQKRIFDRFYRVDDDKKYLISGLGMGLYISSQIINYHKGTIGVNSEMGMGSTFYFILPLADG